MQVPKKVHELSNFSGVFEYFVKVFLKYLQNTYDILLKRPAKVILTTKKQCEVKDETECQVQTRPPTNYDALAS